MVGMPISDEAERKPAVRPLNLDAGLAGSVGEPHYAIVDLPLSFSSI